VATAKTWLNEDIGALTIGLMVVGVAVGMAQAAINARKTRRIRWRSLPTTLGGQLLGLKIHDLCDYMNSRMGMLSAGSLRELTREVGRDSTAAELYQELKKAAQTVDRMRWKKAVRDAIKWLRENPSDRPIPSQVTERRSSDQDFANRTFDVLLSVRKRGAFNEFENDHDAEFYLSFTKMTGQQIDDLKERMTSPDGDLWHTRKIPGVEWKGPVDRGDWHIAEKKVKHVFVHSDLMHDGWVYRNKVGRYGAWEDLRNGGSLSDVLHI